ncbi:MAG: hypothetical protein DMF62_02740 [Acidobacteria bacterium]|nr:MAG: hypothetical protein DMF62_02740 [Acidobacteriota bacterium]
MALKALWITLLGVWLVLVLMGKGGFIHLLLLNGVSVLMIDLVAIYRSRNVRDAINENGPANN